MKLFGTLLIFLAAGTSSFAAVAVPEIDGSTAVSSVVLIAGGLVVLRSRRKK